MKSIGENIYMLWKKIYSFLFYILFIHIINNEIVDILAIYYIYIRDAY